MFLRKIEIINFSVYYGKSSLDFGRNLSSEGKNIYSVGGLNGAGKTSLLKAIILGLLGKNSKMVLDIMSSNSDYKRTIQENFSRQAFENGDKQMSTKLIFEDRGKELTIERKWWFDEQGNFSDEELNIFKDGGPIGIERGANPIEVKEEFIQTKIPPQIAKFFFFDGEEIRKIADKDPSLSVREGLNSLLGFAILEQLVEDLKKSKDEIKRETGKSATKTDLLEAETELCHKQEEIIQIKDELEDKEREKNKLDDQFEIVKMQISSLTGGYESSEHNKIQEQLEELEKEEGQLRSEIGKFVSDLLCVAMPRGILKKLKNS